MKPIQEMTDEELENEIRIAELEEQLAAQPSMSSGEAFLEGAKQGATLGWSDEIGGAIQAGLDVVTGGNVTNVDSALVQQGFTGNLTPDIESLYVVGRDENRAKQAQAMEQQTGAYFAGNIAGSAATTMASGGLFTGIKGAAVAGGLIGLGESVATDAEGLAKDALIGTALSSGGELAMKGVGRFAQRFFTNPNPSNQVLSNIVNQLENSKSIENIDLSAKLSKTAFQHGYETGEALLTSSKGRAVVNSGLKRVPDQIEGVLQQAKNRFAAEYDQVALDNTDTILDTKSIKDAFRTMLVDLKESDPAKQLLQEKVFPIMVQSLGDTSGFQDVLNVSRRIKSLANEMVKSTTGDGRQHAGAMALGFMDKVVDNALYSADVSKNLQKLNALYGSYKQAGEVVEKLRDRPQAIFALGDSPDVISENSWARMDLINHLTTLDNGFALSPTEGYLAQTLTKIAPPVALAKASNAITTQGFSVADYFKATAIGAPVGMMFGAPAGFLAGFAAISPGVRASAANAVGAMTGKLVKKFKIPRTTSAIIDNLPLFQGKIASVNPVLAQTLNDIVQSGNQEELQEFIRESVKQPEVAAVMEPGLGFDGIVTSEEEMQQVETQIKTSGLPLRQQMGLVQNLRATGQIPAAPQMTPEQQLRQRAMQVARDKNGKKIERL